MIGNKIVKTINIEGMSCGHCSKRVEDVLKSIKGVKTVEVSLEDKKAKIVMKYDINNEILKSTIEDIGFKVTEIK